ncbi:MAG: alkaline shock response membrane anchor protein AmaP [Halanaerobiaceae bacterium]|nr:alkaline shock response membrane anchor protein AmaP [Halanaerobiaceae bacterium]
MNLLYRFVIFLMTILFIFASLLLAFYTFGWANPQMLPELISNLYGRWEYGFLFIVFFLAGAWIIYPFFSRERSITSVTVSEHGNVDITIDALDSLVKNIAIEQEGVVAINNRIKAVDDGIFIELDTEVYPSMSIPEISRNLQELVKTHIEDTTGVNVKAIKVLVKEISKENEKGE